MPTAAELKQQIEQLSTDIGLTHTFVHGSKDETVLLGDPAIGGAQPTPTPTVRGLVESVRAATTAAIVDTADEMRDMLIQEGDTQVSRARDEADRACACAQEAETARDEALAVKDEVESMMGVVTYLDGADLGDPAAGGDWQQALNDYALAWGQARGLPWPPLPNSIDVVNLWNGHEWIYNVATGQWIDFGLSTVTVATTESVGVVKPDGVTVTVDAAGTLSAAASLIPDGVSIVSDGNNVISAVMPEPVTPLYVENGELRIDVTAIDSGSSIANDVWFGLLTGVANESFTSSGNYTIQETGLYRLTAVGGGGGGGGGYSTSASCGGGGGAGGTVYKIFRFHAGDNINFVIGGGGAGGAKSTGGGGGGGGGGGETYVKLSETYIVRAGGGGGGGGGNLYNYGGGGGGGDGAGGSGSAGTADVGGKGGNGGGGVPGGLGGSNGSSGTRSFSGSSGFIISSAGVGGSNFLNNGRGKGGNGGNGAAGSSGTSGMVQIASLF